MTTLYDSLKSSLRVLGVVVPGETPTAQQIQDAMDAQNAMLGSLSPLILYANTSEDLTLAAGTASYTIGTGGTFNTGRPTKIMGASYLNDSGNTSYPLEVIDQARYNRISDKTTQGRPEYVMYDPQYALGMVYFYPTPDAAYTFHCVSEKPLTEITNLTATLVLPAEYKSFLKWNTAMALAPEYPGSTGQPGFQIVVREATRSLSIIQRIVAHRRMQETILDCPGVRRNSRTIISF